MNPDTFGWSQTIGSNASIIVSKIPVGYFIVGLSGLAENCIVIPSVSVSTFVSETQRSFADFQVLCFTPR